MTRVAVVVDRTTRKIEIHIEADLTRMVGSPEDYHRLSTEGPAEEFEPLKARVEAGIHFQYEGREIPLEISRFDLPDLALAEFKQTYAAPMTVIQMDGTVPDQAGEIRVLADIQLLVETPIAISFFETRDRRRMTRWVDSGQTSEPFRLPELQAVTIATGSTKLTTGAAEGEPHVEPIGEDTPDAESKTEPAPWESDSPWLTVAGQYLGLGFTHILPKGIDHIFFAKIGFKYFVFFPFS